MTYTKEQITELPDFQGIATNMGDFFVPDDCLNTILVRQGKVKKTTGEIVWMLMAATKIDGSLNLLVYTRSSKYHGEWITSTMISCVDFRNLIEKEYSLKN